MNNVFVHSVTIIEYRVGDEFHFLLECEVFWNYPNILSLQT